MDRKEIIERLREMANGPAAVYGTDALDAFAAAADMLAADGWVKVSERLPVFDDALRVLVYTGGVDFNGEQYFDLRATDLYGDADGQCSEVAEAVTHWRPLPPEPDHD